MLNGHNISIGVCLAAIGVFAAWEYFVYPPCLATVMKFRLSYCKDTLCRRPHWS